MTGISPDASAFDTSVLHLAFLPSGEAYCGDTPTEWHPFLATAAAVSSIISQASLPPTYLSTSTCSSVSSGS